MVLKQLVTSKSKKPLELIEMLSSKGNICVGSERNTYDGTKKHML